MKTFFASIVLLIFSLAPLGTSAQTGDLNAPMILVRVIEGQSPMIMNSEIIIEYGGGRSEQINIKNGISNKAMQENQSAIYEVLEKLYANNYELAGHAGAMFTIMIFRKKE